MHLNPRGLGCCSEVMVLLLLIVRSIERERERELVALLCLTSWCLMSVVWLFGMVPRVLFAVCAGLW